MQKSGYLIRQSCSSELIKPTLRLWEVRGGKAFGSLPSAGKGTAFALCVSRFPFPARRDLPFQEREQLCSCAAVQLCRCELVTLTSARWASPERRAPSPGSRTRIPPIPAPGQAWARSRGTCGSVPLNTICKRFACKCHQVKETQEENDPSGWRAQGSLHGTPGQLWQRQRSREPVGTSKGSKPQVRLTQRVRSTARPPGMRGFQCPGVFHRHGFVGIKFGI